MDKARSKAEIDFSNKSPAVAKSRRTIPDYLKSVKLKYVKLGYYGYSCNFTTFLLFAILFPVILATLYHLWGLDWARITRPILIDTATAISLSSLFFLLLGLYLGARPRPIYLVDFACAKPNNKLKRSIDYFVSLTENSGAFDEAAMNFQTKIARRSGLGDEPYMPAGPTSNPPDMSVREARSEAKTIMFGALDSLFSKTGLNPKEIGIVIVNVSLFCPTPSLTSMIVNKYKLRPDVKTFNLGGMGCSASPIAVDLAKNLLLKANPNTYAIVVSMENITLKWYFGNDRSMLLCNCIFRMGGAAMLLSNKRSDRKRSKYQLIHTVRTHKGADDNSYSCVFEKEDAKGIVGVSLAKDLMVVAGDALKTNITTLGPLVLPFTEQFMFFVTLVRRKIFKAKVKPYIPDFKLAFEHFCIHAGGRAVLDEVEKNLDLSEWHMEPSRMTLHRFGNTSSSSLWYELAYTEAKGRVSKGQRVWQIAFGSGFKCNSAVWRALRDISPSELIGNPWDDSVGKYPIQIPL